MALDYALLDGKQDNAVSVLARTASARTLRLLGLVLTSLAGVTVLHKSYSSSPKGDWSYQGAPTSAPTAPSFFPPLSKEELRNVINIPDTPGPLLLFPLRELSCLFAYSNLLKHFYSSEQDFDDWVTDEEGWVYGVRLSLTGKLAYPTGLPDNVLQGRLICFTRHSFGEKLREADDVVEYNAVSPDELSVARRGVVSVVLKDKSAKKAYWYYQLKPDTVQTIVKKIKLPIVIVPGFMSSAEDYEGLRRLLEDAGATVRVVPLTRLDWVPTIGTKSMIPILKKLDKTITLLLRAGNGKIKNINLVAHSAAGWISRIYLGDVPYTIHKDITEAEGHDKFWGRRKCVNTLVTLGTPHVSQEPFSRANLEFVNYYYPGAFHKSVKYVCVAGKTVFGDENAQDGRLAYQSYQMIGGMGNTWGDGITPVVAAHLDNAENLVLEGAKHAPSFSGQWYGDPGYVEEWLSYLN